MTYLETIWQKLEGYLLIPHELLHVAGYRLVGKRCHYRLGERRVVPIGPLGRQERLVGLLFPFVVWSVLFVFLTGLAGLVLLLVSRQNGNIWLWLAILGPLCLAVGGYLGTTAGDLDQAYRLLRRRPAKNKVLFSSLRWLESPQPIWVPLLALSLAALALVALILSG